MSYKPFFYPDSCNEDGHLTVPVLLTGRALGFARCVVSFVTYFTQVLTRRAAFQAAAICGVLTLFGVAEAGAQTQEPREYQRGIWYDSAVDQATLGPKNEVDKLYKQGVRRVHIMVDESIQEKAINCDCVQDPEVWEYFRPRNYDPEVKVKKTNAYHRCLKTEAGNPWCARASNYSFGFDKWGPESEFERFDRLGQFIKQLNRKNIAVIITIWPEPTSTYIDGLSNLIRYIKKYSVYGIELEDEENWSEVFTEHGTKQELDDEARKLITKLTSALPAVNIGVTAAGGGTEFLPKYTSRFTDDALLTSPKVAFISFQAYQNTHKKTDKGIVCGDPSKISGNDSPESLAAHAIDLARSAEQLNRKNLIVGLSAYQLDCPRTGQKPRAKGVSGTLNMYMAAKESICAAVEHKAMIVGDSYFSEHNVVNQRDGHNFYANNFLSLCQINSIRARCGEPPAVDDNADTSETLLISELNHDCPNIIDDLTNNVAVTPGQAPAGGREIYVQPR
jgi:hypothetical protein